MHYALLLLSKCSHSPLSVLLIYVFLKIRVAIHLSVLADHRCRTQSHLSTSPSRSHSSLTRLTLLHRADTRRETGCDCEYGTGSCALAGCHRVLAGCRPRNRFHSCGRNGSLIRVGRRRVPSPSPTLAPAPPRRAARRGTGCDCADGKRAS